MSEFQALPLINNLICGNSIIEKILGDIHKSKVRTQSWKYRSPSWTSSREIGYMGAFLAKLNSKLFNIEIGVCYPS